MTDTDLVKYSPGAAVGSAKTLKSLLQQQAAELAQTLPHHVTPERLIRMAMVAVNRTPKLLQCSQSSVLETIMRAASLGLDISGTLGDAYPVPFKSTCQLIVGYRGLARLARQSGEVRRIEAEVVYEKDTFEFQKGSELKLVFKPSLEGDRGKPRGAYALAEGDGWIQTEWMTVSDIEGIRRRSMAANDGPWVTDWSEMARKTVFRRLAKWLPLSPDKAESFHEAAHLDAESFEIDVTPSTEERLVEKIRAAGKGAEEPPAGDHPHQQPVANIPEPPSDLRADLETRNTPWIRDFAKLNEIDVSGIKHRPDIIDAIVKEMESRSAGEWLEDMKSVPPASEPAPEEEAEPEEPPVTTEEDSKNVEALFGKKDAGAPDEESARILQSAELRDSLISRMKSAGSILELEQVGQRAKKHVEMLLEGHKGQVNDTWDERWAALRKREAGK